MAVIISDSRNGAYNGNISTALGFYRVEAHQLSNFGTATGGNSLSSAKTIDITFANAGNCMGVILNLITDSSAAININKMKDVTVVLQELVLGVWTTRATKVLTPDQLHNNSTGKPAWVSTHQTFDFATPYAVDATAGKWRFSVSNAATTYPATATLDWNLRNGTTSAAIMFCTWCDTQISYTSGDTLIVKSPVTLNQSVTLNGILSTGSGDTTNGICLLICKSDNLSDFFPLKWAAAPAASYTLTIKGVIVSEAYAGFQIGTTALPIPFAQQAIITEQPATAGTRTGYVNYSIGNNRNTYRTYIDWNGQVPTVRKGDILYQVIQSATTTFNTGSGGYFTGNTSAYSNGNAIRFTTTGTLPAAINTSTTYYMRNLSSTLYRIYPTRADALANTNAITLADVGTGTHTVHGVIITSAPTGWSVGMRVYTAKGWSTSNPTDITATISAISGNEIRLSTVSTNIAAGGYAISADAGYGIKFTATTATRNYIGSPSVWNMVGCTFELVDFNTNINAAQWMKDPNRIARWNVSSNYVMTHTSASSQGAFLQGIGISSMGMDIKDNYFILCRAFASTRLAPEGWDGYGDGSSQAAGIFLYDGNYQCSTSFSGIDFNGSGFIVRNNKFLSNGNNIAQYSVSFGQSAALASSEVYNNYYWACLSGADIYWGNTRDIDWHDDQFENHDVVMTFNGSKFTSFILRNGIFGIESPNTNWVYLNDFSYADVEFQSCTGVFTMNTTFQPSIVPESFIRITDGNDVANVDYSYQREGNLVRTGTALADTTAHNSGFAIRFESISSTVPLTWIQKLPTGNIQNKTMTVGCWVKINNAAYYAGTHQKPRITINYDNGTEVYAEALATTAWQFILVSFTPVTTYGQITVTSSTMTDATGTNRYVYFDDFTAPLPQGVELNLGSLDLWANALPVTPVSFATAISAADVWAANPSNFGAGTVGDRVNKIKKIVTGLQ